MSDEEKQFAIKINVDKAKNKSIPLILLISISILTYIPPLIVGEFDFGIVFEVISFLFLLIAIKYMKNYDEIRSKRYVVYAIIPIGWLLIYDLIAMISSLKNFIDFLFLGYDYYFSEILLIVYILVLFKINKDLAKADNPIKYKESTDWFYETLSEKDRMKKL